MTQLRDCNRPYPRKTIMQKLICNTLGYCCFWAFFRFNKSTPMIALRLGVTERTVQRYKADFAAGRLKCENCDKCLKSIADDS